MVEFFLGFQDMVEGLLEVLEVGFDSWYATVVFVAVIKASGDDVFVINLDHGIEFSSNTSDVVINHDLRPGNDLFLFKGADFNKDFGGFWKVGEDLREFFVNVESSSFGFNGPFLAVSVTIESDVLGLSVKVSHD